MHFFDPEIAKQVGVNAAVIYQNILFWTEKNYANGKHIIDGYVWTYNSVKAWELIIPYLTGKQIRLAIRKLVDAGLIIEGNYNKSAYDRTKWFGLSEKIHLTKKANENSQKGEPIPNVNTDSKPDVPPIVPPQGEPVSSSRIAPEQHASSALAGCKQKASSEAVEVFEHWKQVMQKSGRTILDAKRKRAITARLKEGYTVVELKTAIEGCAATPHNMGQNQHKKRYDDIELICRNASNVDRFIQNGSEQRQKDADMDDFLGEQATGDFIEGEWEVAR